MAILTYVKSTKGTHVYATDDPKAPITSVYVKREALPKEPPKTINLELNTGIS